ncbi:hypothetical protein KR074_012515, partial [Drosophila pseudoananassae]
TKSKEVRKIATKELGLKLSAQHFPPVRIPKNVLQRTLTIANDTTDAFWLNINVGCTPSASYEMSVETGFRRSLTYEKLHLARCCLLQRDYKNLAKLLTSNIYGETILQKNAFNIYSEYASLLQKFTKIKEKSAQGIITPSP